MNTAKLFSDIFNFILITSSKYKIDESHDISHSMNVLHYAHSIYETELYTNPGIKPYKNIIYISAALHDMCDKKYMDESIGIKEITTFTNLHLSSEDSDIISKIITTMSYSKVKINGFPDLGIYQSAYHAVREADLLAAYDFDRCIIYDMKVNGKNFDLSFQHAEDLFENRVFKHADDNLFTTVYAKQNYPTLHTDAVNRMNTWRNILKLPSRL